MSKALLGMPFDIHTGGIDHREIHHPNEIAQNQAHEGCADSGARIWMHNNFLVERSGKMSKSSGEFLRLQLLIDKGFHPLAFRLMCLQAHYRSELEFSWEGLQAAFVRLKRMVMGVTALKGRHAELVSASIVQPSSGFADGWTLKQVQGDESIWPRFGGLFELIDGSACDDLNTPGLLLWIQSALELQDATAEEHLSMLGFIDQLLGLNLLTLTRQDLRIRPKAAVITEVEIESALAARKEARAKKDFATSDRIRDDLIAKGVEVMDGDPLGWDWKLDI
jgi:cysteinyl-tRNA synthetase